MTLVMQNKPNLLDTLMNVSSVKTKHYENNRLRTRRKNKPNQTQFQTRRLRAYPNNRPVMRPSEKFEAKAAGATIRVAAERCLVRSSKARLIDAN